MHLSKNIPLNSNYFLKTTKQGNKLLMLVIAKVSDPLKMNGLILKHQPIAPITDY